MKGIANRYAIALLSVLMVCLLVVPACSLRLGGSGRLRCGGRAHLSRSSHITPHPRHHADICAAYRFSWITTKSGFAQSSYAQNQNRRVYIA